jgi:hypothetical protein
MGQLRAFPHRLRFRRGHVLAVGVPVDVMRARAGQTWHGMTLSLNTVFDILASPRRRFALLYLHEHSRSIAIADLIREISVNQHEVAKNEVPEEVLKQETTLVHHCHLPKLLDANLVAIDSDRKTVRATETLHSIEPLLVIAAKIEQ